MNNFKNTFLLFFLFLGLNSFSQDFDIYHKLKDDNIKIPKMYENTLFDDYQILARDIRMMDMAYAAIVPGYIHFKAKDNRTGYMLLSARMLGFSGIAANYFRMKSEDKYISDIFTSDKSYNADKIILISSISLIFSTYLFDWIHGKARLEKKQELIRYRYGIKFNMENQAQTYNSYQISPSFSVSYTF
ncbi:MAG: hypothetical protein JXR51_02820 [Bacteroidales bacterium]|nr:hypothetical protein [Bacteroidales bacterium]MBN2756082.1 hypothetical protein [Bacteroidales bacterium]